LISCFDENFFLILVSRQTRNKKKIWSKREIKNKSRQNEKYFTCPKEVKEIHCQNEKINI